MEEPRSEDLILRPITPDDVEGVASLHESQNERPAHRQNIRRWISEFPSSLALHEDRILGFAYTGRFAPDVLELNNILVTAESRGRRVGTRLLEHLEEQCADRWSAMILSHSELWPHPERRSPIEFYTRHGYRRIWETPHTVVMAKSLVA